jgi:molecular chaperone HtpG
LLTDPVDEYLVASLHAYKGKSLKAVDRGDADAGGDPVAEEQKKQFQPLLETLKGKLGGEVKDVRLSARLKESAAVLVADEGAMSAHLERLMQRMGRGDEVPAARRILELNPNHPAVQALLTLREKDANDPRLDAYGWLLYDEAVIAEGSRIKDPAGFARRVNELIAKVVAG